MKVINCAKTYALAGIVLAAAALPKALYSKSTLKQDSFVRLVSPKGTYDENILLNAPKSDITISGKKMHTTIIVDLKTNTLYKYDNDGKPEAAFLIASGKSSTPTHTGVRIVSHIEKYPYSGAPSNSKRRRNPKDYGPYILILNKLNPETGEQSSTGEFIHGCRNEDCLGKYVSHGCMRMANDVITDLATQQIKSGDIVLIKR